MPPRADSLVLAALRTEGPENRLTELFAVVLAEHERFARGIFEQADLPLPHDELQLEARTQIAVRLGIVDLEALAWSGTGTSRLWCEDKRDADFQHEQLERYRESMPAGSGRLVAVVRDRNKVEAREYCARVGAKLLTWEGVATIADQAGRGSTHSRGRWRREARRPYAPSQQRVLSDFLGYMEKELGILTEPLTTAHAAALRDAGIAGDVARFIFDQAVERSSYEKVPGQEWPNPSRREPTPTYQDCLLRSPDESRPPWLEGWFELMRHPFEAMVGEPPEDQAFLVGVTLDRDRGEVLFSDELELWRADVRNAVELGGLGFRVFRRDKWTHVWRPLFLVELATRCASLDEQIRHLAAWIDESIAYIARHPPPV